MNDHLPDPIRAALAPYAPPVESLNDDDAYIVDLGNNRVVRQCSLDLARSGISVTLGHAVMTGMHARHHIGYEQERRAKLGKPAGGEISPENRTAEVQYRLIRITEQRDKLLAFLEGIAQYRGEGPANADWRGVVAGIGSMSRDFLAEVKGGAA